MGVEMSFVMGWCACRNLIYRVGITLRGTGCGQGLEGFGVKRGEEGCKDVGERVGKSGEVNE